MDTNRCTFPAYMCTGSTDLQHYYTAPFPIVMLEMDKWPTLIVTSTNLFDDWKNTHLKMKISRKNCISIVLLSCLPGFDANIFMSKSLMYVESMASEQTGTMCRLIGDALGKFTHAVIVKFSRPRSSSGCRIVFGFFYENQKKYDKKLCFAFLLYKKCLIEREKSPNLSQFGHGIGGNEVAFWQSRYEAHNLILTLAAFFFAQHECFQYL